VACQFSTSTASNSAEKNRAKPKKQKGKKEGGWGEFRLARVFRRARRGGYVRFRFLNLCIRFGKIISKIYKGLI